MEQGYRPAPAASKRTRLAAGERQLPRGTMDLSNSAGCSPSVAKRIATARTTDNEEVAEIGAKTAPSLLFVHLRCASSSPPRRTLNQIPGGGLGLSGRRCPSMTGKPEVGNG